VADDRGFCSRRGNRISPNAFSHTMALTSTQPLTSQIPIRTGKLEALISLKCRRTGTGFVTSHFWNSILLGILCTELTNLRNPKTQQRGYSTALCRQALQTSSFDCRLFYWLCGIHFPDQRHASSVSLTPLKNRIKFRSGVPSTGCRSRASAEENARYGGLVPPFVFLISENLAQDFVNECLNHRLNVAGFWDVTTCNVVDTMDTNSIIVHVKFAF
jgi:hypothetical protein